jgi:hypothetical protein
VVQNKDGLKIQIHPLRRYFYNYTPSNNKHLQIMIRNMPKLCCIFSCITIVAGSLIVITCLVCV